MFSYHPKFIEQLNFDYYHRLSERRYRPKSDEASRVMRLMGNTFYNMRMYKDALKAYNTSLFSAESDENISMAYANRSAVYCEVKLYKECLFNIDKAIEHNYPAEKMAKLLIRKKICEENAADENKIPGVIENFFQLSHPANLKIPFIINDLELKTTEEFGRGIYATRDLKCGDIIAIEEPYFTMSNNMLLQERCCVCLKSNFLNLLPCEETIFLMFCSEKCLNYSKVFSTFNCLEELKLDESPHSMKIKFDIRQKLNFDTKFIKEAFKKRERVSIFDFDLSDPSSENYERDRLKCAFGIHQSFEEPDAEDFDLHLANTIHRNQYIRFEKHSTEKIDGRGLHLFGLLMNHSCMPNVEFIEYDNKHVFCIRKPVKKGEQLFIKYTLPKCTCKSGPEKNRRIRFKEIFNFDCKCDFCNSNDVFYDEKIDLPDPQSVNNAIDRLQEINRLENDEISKVISAETTMLMKYLSTEYSFPFEN